MTEVIALLPPNLDLPNSRPGFDNDLRKGTSTGFLLVLTPVLAGTFPFTLPEGSEGPAMLALRLLLLPLALAGGCEGSREKALGTDGPRDGTREKARENGGVGGESGIELYGKTLVRRRAH